MNVRAGPCSVIFVMTLYQLLSCSTQCEATRCSGMILWKWFGRTLSSYDGVMAESAGGIESNRNKYEEGPESPELPAVLQEFREP